MNKFNKFAAAATSFALAAAAVGCTPTIGKGTDKAMTINGYDVKSGVFIFYTIQAYNDAADIIEEQNGTAPTVKEVKNAHIDTLEATDWIQDKAIDYCKTLAAIENEFNSIGGQLTTEEQNEIDELAESYYDSDQFSIFADNGVGIESFKTIISSVGSGNNYYGEYEYMQKHIFDYYYGFEGTKGCTEDELKDYFDENFARVKYISISLTDQNGDPLSDDEKRELRKMADDYAAQINGESSELDKMHKLDEMQEDYDEYVEAHTTTTTAEGEEAIVTTTTTTVTDEDTEQTTTTTDPYANERLVQRYTTTTADTSDTDTDTTTTETEETDSDKADREYKQFVFDELETGKAVVYEYDENTLYVLIRGDLRERMTEDDFWSEDYIYSLQLLRYNDDFVDYLEQLADSYSVEKNKSSFRRYAPFKLDLSSLEPTT